MVELSGKETWLVLYFVLRHLLQSLLNLTLQAPIPQNGQTHSNNSSAICEIGA